MTREFRVFGVVQGVGFRPFVYRLAEKYGLSGYVANKGSYVKIVAAGAEKELEAFQQGLVQNAPQRAAVLHLETRETEEFTGVGFSIEKSEADSGSRFVSPDIAML